MHKKFDFAVLVHTIKVELFAPFSKISPSGTLSIFQQDPGTLHSETAQANLLLWGTLVTANRRIIFESAIEVGLLALRRKISPS